MQPKFSFLNASLLLSAVSLLLAVTSVTFARQVNYLDHLFVFSAMAVTMLGLALAALGVGLAGIWKSKGRRASLWLANLLAALVIGMYVLNP